MNETMKRPIQKFTDYINGSVYVDKDGQDCTNGGASSKYNTLYVVAEHVTLQDVQYLVACEHQDPRGDHDLQVEQFFKVDYEFARKRNYVRLEPINKGGKWHMFGGNFLRSSDSRFKEFVYNCPYPVPILDRTEG